MPHPREFYLMILGFAFMEIRWVISVQEPDDYADLCRAMVDLLRPIPPALLTWSIEREGSLYDDMKMRSVLADRAGLFHHWASHAEGSVKEVMDSEEAFDARMTPHSGFSSIHYLRLLSRVVGKMEESKDDLTILYALADAFHNLPGALIHAWTDEREERVYTNLMMRATDRGVRSEVEQWIYEIVGDPAKARAARLPF